MQDCPEDDDDEFLKRCVMCAERAKALGWVMIEGYNFLCPKCAARTKAARILRSLSSSRGLKSHGSDGRHLSHLD